MWTSQQVSAWLPGHKELLGKQRLPALQGRSPHPELAVLPLEDLRALLDIEMASGDATTNGTDPRR